MNNLKNIKSPVKEELTKFHKDFSGALKSQIPLLDIITKYILKRKGKQIRPLLVFLSAKAIDNVNESTFHAASLVEILHTATLIHDDVVDDSYERRGFFSINVLWKSKVAVLIGDFFLAKGLLLAIENKEFGLLETVSHATKEMSEGELLQIQKSRKLNITEDVYFNIIRKKTATLLASCTAAGARSVTSDKEVINNMHEFGINLGLAFQIKDDLFDYEKSTNTGKPVGNDIKEKKLTLPLISALANSSKESSNKIIKLLNNKNNKENIFRQIVDFVITNKGDEYARKKMFEYRNACIENLSFLKDSESKTALLNLVNYIVERKK